MRRIRIYTVHTSPAPWRREEDAVFIKDGFCWPAFVFSLLWALWHRLWLGGLIMFAGELAIDRLADWTAVHRALEVALLLGWMLLIGFEANDWRRRKLSRQGYLFAAVVAAHSLGEAERRFFDKHPGQSIAATA